MKTFDAAILTGALIGDSLGAPFQGYKSGHIQQLAGDRVEGFLTDGNLNPGKPDKNTLPGLHSCHGQYLIAMMASVMEDYLAREPGAKVAAQLVELVGEAELDPHAWGGLRRPGRSLRTAITQWKEEYPWEEKDHFARGEKTEGISAAISGVAVAMLGKGDPMRLARLTHCRASAVIAPVVIQRVFALLKEHGGGKKLDGEGLAREALVGLADVEEAYCEEQKKHWRDIGWGQPLYRLTDCLSPLPSLLREANDDLAVRTLVNTAAECHPEQAVGHPQHGFAPTALTWVLYRALGPMVPSHALEDVINRGGETSVLGLIVGGMMAARYGLEHFPEEWLSDCRALELIPILEKGLTQSAFDQWLSRESEWTREEEAMRAPLRAALEKKRQTELERDRLKPRKSKAKQGDLALAPPEHLRIHPDEMEHPAVKKKMKEARAKRRIDWKEDRRDSQRDKGEIPSDDE